MTDTPRPEKDVHATSVFLGGPFAQLVDPGTGTIAADHQRIYQQLIAHCENWGAVVHNAHRREAWGARFLAPREATRLDYAEIKESELFVAFPGSPPSPGTHVEIGWASAMGKPMILLLKKSETYAFLVTGLEGHANVEIVWYSEPDEITDLLDTAAARVLSRRSATIVGS